MTDIINQQYLVFPGRSQAPGTGRNKKELIPHVHGKNEHSYLLLPWQSFDNLHPTVNQFMSSYRDSMLVDFTFVALLLFAKECMSHTFFLTEKV